MPLLKGKKYHYYRIKPGDNLIFNFVECGAPDEELGWKYGPKVLKHLLWNPKWKPYVTGKKWMYCHDARPGAWKDGTSNCYICRKGYAPYRMVDPCKINVHRGDERIFAYWEMQWTLAKTLGKITLDLVKDNVRLETVIWRVNRKKGEKGTHWNARNVEILDRGVRGFPPLLDFEKKNLLDLMSIVNTLQRKVAQPEWAQILFSPSKEGGYGWDVERAKYIVSKYINEDGSPTKELVLLGETGETSDGTIPSGIDKTI